MQESQILVVDFLPSCTIYIMHIHYFTIKAMVFSNHKSTCIKIKCTKIVLTTHIMFEKQLSFVFYISQLTMENI